MHPLDREQLPVTRAQPAGLLALMAYTGTARYSVDYYLEQKISWWYKVAELGRPAQDSSAGHERARRHRTPRRTGRAGSVRRAGASRTDLSLTSPIPDPAAT